MKRISLLFCLLLSAMQMRAQTMDSLFVTVPEPELPLLDRNARLDMLDLYNYKMTAKGENIFGGTSLMEVKEKDFVRLKLTEVSHWEMMRLAGDSTHYVCIHTIEQPIRVSRIRCYDSDWKPCAALLPATDSLTLDNFLTDSISVDTVEDVYRRLGPLHVEAVWKETSGAAPQLVFSASVAHLSEEHRKVAEKCLKPVIYLWKDGCFQRL